MNAMTVLIEKPAELGLRFLVEVTVNFLGEEIYLFPNLQLLCDHNLYLDENIFFY